MKHRSRLDQVAPVYSAVRELSGRLRDADLDLAADGLGGAMRGTTQDSLLHLSLELRRLSMMSAIRSAALELHVDRAARLVEAAIGRVDDPHQPLYSSLRDLADVLELNRGRPLLARLREAVVSSGRDARSRLDLLAELLSEASTATEPLPDGASTALRGAMARIGRVMDPDTAIRFAQMALLPPAAFHDPREPVPDAGAPVRLIARPAGGLSGR